jgi:hypothetical protein
MKLDKVYNILDSIKPDQYDCHPSPWMSRQITLNGKKIYLCRLVLERKLGRSIKPGFFALHHCDYPKCVNPDHLYEGTGTENQADRKLRNPKSWECIRENYHGNLRIRTKMLENLKKGWDRPKS